MHDGRAEVDRHRTLLVERDRMNADNRERVHAIFAGMPDGPMREEALRTEARSTARSPSRSSAR